MIQGLALATLLACALWLRMSIAWEELESVLLRATSDDAFYYLQIARNWMEGAPPSLDGETPTNGFHPLWLWLCALAWAVGGEPVPALRIALSLGAVLGTATTALVWATLRRLGTPAAAALLAAAFHGLHPYFALESVNGLESALAVFCIALLTWRFVIVAQRSARLDRGDGALLGAIAAAMLLARTDTAFVWAGVGTFLALRAARHGGWPGVATAAGVSAALLAPWLVWSATSLGGIVQVSGYAISEPSRLAYLETHGDSLAVLLDRSAFLVRDAFLQKLFRSYFVPAGWPTAPAWLLAAATILALLYALPEPERGRARRRLGLLAVPGAGVVLGLAWHAGVRWWLREWYFAPAGWLGVMVVGVGLGSGGEWIARAASRHAHAVTALATGIVALAMALLLAPGDGSRWGTQTPHRVTQLEGARWIRDHLPPGTRLGAFNAGILSYFSERTVVNLDGVVNADAYRARRDGRMMDYILLRKLDYLVDWQGYLALAGCGAHPEARCAVESSLGLPHPRFGPGPLLLVRVEPAGGR